MRGVQPGGADTRPTEASPQIAGQGQTARLHARPEQPDSQGRHRGGLGKTCRGQLSAGLRQLQHPGELPGGQGHPGHFLPGDQAVRMRHHALSHGLQPAGAVHRQLPRQRLRLQSRLRPVPHPVGRRPVLLLQGTPEGIGGHAPDHVLHRPAGAARLHRHHGQGGQGQDDRQRQLLLYRAFWKRQVVPHGEKQDKTAASDYKNDCYKYLIYSQYILTNEETGYWRLVLIGVNLYHSCTSPEGSHGSISFQQRATAFNSVQINFFDDGPSK